ncbi:membrane protein [Synergistales bacterium]|nr:membrane protein [Synergistales bacterium]
MIVAFLIYRVMLFFVGTRAMQLGRGLLMICAAGAIARSLDLRSISWLMSNLLSAFLIAIPIVFQPELRHLLEVLGRGRLLGGSQKGGDGEANADALFRAVMYLQHRRIGALIVFQRDTGLRELWRGAVPIGASITQELIGTIFWEGTPLHDGAIIIDRQMIMAAKCILPLTENAGILRGYGTRHRAAVGVTEVSDAYALVVSEERGSVSLAVKGKLSHPLTDEQAKLFIHRYFSFSDNNGKISLLKRVKSELEQKWPNWKR